MSDLSAHFTRPSWAPWALDTRNYELIYVSSDQIADYPVDLERCLDPANLLDWVFQIVGRWGDGPDGARIVLGFLQAVDDLLAPQQNLCSFGKPSSISQRTMRRLVDDHVSGS